MQTVFQATDYKEFIRSKIEENRTWRAYQTRLAEAMRCQKSFLSQVLRGSAHLTIDQSTALCEFWKLTDAESDYFLDLIFLARAGTPTARDYFHRRMLKRLKMNETLTENFSWPALEIGEVQLTYYSSWYWSAIHMLCVIPEYSSAAVIADRLGLPASIVERSLLWLENVGLIVREKQSWRLTQKTLYLPESSPMIEMHHFNWRQRALANIQSQDRESSHYSSVFTLSIEDFRLLKRELIHFIEEMNARIAPSPSEEIVAFSCDLFRV